MKEWQLQDAKQRFSELVRAAESEGPQVVTRHGKEVAVMVDVSTYRAVRWEPTDFKAYLTSGPAFDELEIQRDEKAAPTVDLG
jgi:prevent-host-death family protein